MAEEQDQERHLPASQKRLDDAREHGQVPRSRELTTAVLLLGAAAVFVAGGPLMMQASGDFLGNALTLPPALAFDTAAALRRSFEIGGGGLLIVTPLFAVLLAVALLAPLLIGGWIFTMEPAIPDFSRLDPFKGLSNLLSLQALAELGKALAKVSLVGLAAYLVLAGQQAETTAYPGMAPQAALSGMGHLVTLDFLVISAVLLAVALADVPLQIWRHARGLRMSEQEVKRETRESEGDPQLKARIRQRQREGARRRMMAAVPNADVVVTNPAHYAVALSYQASMRAPRVVAKGRDEVAARIRDLAAAHGVPLLAAPPLARALYAHAEIESEIPAALYNAVAQVLAYVYQLRAAVAGRAPAQPQDIEVPAELDPFNTVRLPAGVAA